VSTCFEEAPSGAERVARNLATCLATDHDVVLVGLSGTDLVAWDLAGSVLLKTPLVRGQSLDGRVTGHAGSKLLWHLRDTYRLSAPRALTAMSRHLGLDLVNTHTIVGLSSSAWRSLAAAGIPSVHVFHDYSLLCVRGSFYRGGQLCPGRCAECRPRQAASKYLVERTATFISPSRYCARQHERDMTLRPGSVTVIPNAAAASPHRTRLRSEPCNFLFVGKLECHKGIRLLIKAIQSSAGLPLRVTFIGGGSLVEELRHLEAADSRVRLRETLALTDLQGAYLEAKWLLVPSIWPENAPMVAFEALATGLPLVLSPVGGLPELGDDTGAGVATRGVEPSDWVEVFRRLCENEIDVEPMSKAAIAYSATSTLDQMGIRYLEVFNRAHFNRSPST
jgi:glycosyltransferase involved in cell wall biosynthesis